MKAKRVSFLMKRGVFFGEAMPLAEERTLRYGQEKQRSVIKKVAFAAQRLASKHALTPHMRQNINTAVFQIVYRQKWAMGNFAIGYRLYRALKGMTPIPGPDSPDNGLSSLQDYFPFHLIPHPALGYCSSATGAPASTALRAARKSLPVSGMPLPGREPSRRPR